MSADIVRFEGVSKRYRLGLTRTSLPSLVSSWVRGRLGRGDGPSSRQDLWALQDVNFRLQRGQSLALVGPNGAGKTTTLKAILGLIRRDGGTIHVAGIDPEVDGRAARSRLGFVHDEPHLPRHLTLRAIARLVSGFYPAWNDVAFRRLASAL